MYIEIIRNVVDNYVSTYSANFGQSLSEILSEIKIHIEKINQGYFCYGKTIDYDHPLCGLGYLYRYGSAHATLFEKVIQQSEVGDEITRSHGSLLDVCAIGGGPGTELLGLSKYLVTYPCKIPKTIKFNLLDNNSQWKEKLDLLSGAIQTKIDSHFGKRAPSIQISFHPMDILNIPSCKNLSSEFQKTHVVVFNYLFSEIQTKLDVANCVIRDLANYAPEKTIFVVIDRLEYTLQEDVKQIFEPILGSIEINKFGGRLDNDEQTSDHSCPKQGLKMVVEALQDVLHVVCRPKQHNTSLQQEGFGVMVRQASLFSQLLRQVPRSEFDHLVRRHGAEKGAKGFTCWTQFVAMLFCHLGRADSLREICHGLACCVGKLVHLGIGRAPKRSSLSYANAHRPADLFEDLFWHLADRLRSREGLGRRKRKFRFKNKLMSLDSTTISLCLSLFPWARFRRAKGGVKVHVLLDHDDYMPSYVLLTEARRHDRMGARLLRLNPGSIVAMDRAYNDYQLFADWTAAGIFFVTRLKDNADYEVIEERRVPKNSSILSDQVIRLVGKVAQKKCRDLLRRVVVWDEANQRRIVLLSNHLEFGATTIAAIYQDRWEIELFFKTLKQHLKVRTFVGTSENALRIQIWTALIALLLLKWLHYQSHLSWSFSNLATMLRLNLFTYRDLLEWLKEPFGPPSVPEAGSGALQLHLSLPGFGQPQNL